MRDLLFKTQNPKLRKEAWRKINAITVSHLPKAIRMLQSHSESERLVALDYVALLRPPTVESSVHHIYLNDPSGRVKERALYALIRLARVHGDHHVLNQHADEAIKLVGTALREPPGWAAEGLADWLVQLDHPDAFFWIVQLLRHRDDSVRHRTVIQIREYAKDPRLYALVPRLANDRSRRVKLSVASTITAHSGKFMPDFILPYLTKLAADEDHMVRLGAVDSLARIRWPQAIEVLGPLLADPDTWVKESVAIHLWRMLGEDRLREAAKQVLIDNKIDRVSASALSLIESGPAVEAVLAVIAANSIDDDGARQFKERVAEERISDARTLEQAPPAAITRTQIVDHVDQFLEVARQFNYRADLDDTQILISSEETAIGKVVLVAPFGGGKFVRFVAKPGSDWNTANYPPHRGKTYVYRVYYEEEHIRAALALLELGRRTTAFEVIRYRFDMGPTNDTPLNLLAMSAFAYHANKIADPAVPLADAYTNLKRIADSGYLPPEVVQEETGHIDVKYESLVHALRKSLEPNQAAAGSIEWHINDLVNSTLSGYRFGALYDDRYQKLRDFGLKAIPAAIEHLGDNRVSRAAFSGGGAAGPRFYMIHDIMVNFLWEFTAGNILPHESWKVTREGARAWWSAHEDLSEEEYLVRNAVVRSDLQGDSRTLNRMLGAKYPRRLGEVYARALRERSPGSAAHLANEIAVSVLPKPVKVDLLRAGLASYESQMRVSAIKALAKVDVAMFKREFLRDIGRELSHEHFRLANAWPDEDIWQELARLVEKSELSVRLDYVSMGVTSLSGPSPAQLRFLLHFFDDAECDPEKVGQPIEKVGYLGYSVQNLAAARAGYYLLKPAKLPDAGETKAFWEQYRKKVRALINRRLG
ncbi:MAG: HEAT repeat domain-containing protein [Fimbriimonadales bacterium]